MIDRIKTHGILSKYTVDNCCENEVCVTFDKGIKSDSYVILKVDNFYNSLNIATRPASIDCLVIRRCEKSGYGITLIELKKTEKSKTISIENIKEKFETTLYDFIKNRFKNPLDINYLEVKLFFVCNKEIYRRDLGLKMEALINVRFKFNNMSLMINLKMPNPVIKKCYM